MSGEAAYVVFVLQSLKGEWEKYRDLKVWASREVKQLQNGLNVLEAFLKDADNITEKNNFFKERERERQIRDLVYDIQDTIEMNMTKMAAANNKNILSRLWANISTDMEEKVKDIREKRVQPILTEIENTFWKPQVNNNGSISRLENQLPEVEINEQEESEGQRTSQKDQKQRKIVDFQEEKKIFDIIFESKKPLDVIAITGMAGLGKTTFARKIYDHKDVVAQFPLRIWITVSENFNSTDTFREIWKRLTVKDSFETDEELIDSVRKFLERKEKFLLVIDGVWTEKDWREIKKILPEKKQKGNGKVLVTTREIDVANACSDFRLPHQLKVLDRTKSLELLKYQVFDELDEFRRELEDIGQVIAYKCGGVPQVILVIGCILKKLYFEEDRVIPNIQKKWSEVSKNLDENIGKDDNLILDAVEVSYKRLSHDLRLCFLYTGLFPENHEIPASTLTQLWIAEGFVAWKGSAEENADQILKTLIKMNLVMVGKKNVEQVKTCWVHDMMRVFCRKKAEEENLFIVIKISNKEPPSPAVILRRLCFDADPSGFLKNNLKCVRSFLSFSKGSIIESRAMQISTVTAVSKLLRVLNCRSIKFKQFPEVKRLMLLKHLTLLIENLKYLPKEVSQLINLQTLIVDTDSGFITVKANIWKMVRLKRLKTNVAIFLDDKNWKSDYSGNLETITRLSPKSCKTSLCIRAPHLKTLGVRGKLANVEGTKTMLLGDFLILEKLRLENDESNPMVFTKLDWFPPNLKSLTLIDTFLQWDIHMPLLAKIEKLEVLKLKKNAFTGENWEANDGAAFPKLEFLLMENLKLTTWKASDNDFPIIMSLVIKKCVLLTEIPESLANHLSNLEIEGLLSSAVKSAKEIAKIQIKRNQEERPECEVAFKLTIDQVPISVTINEDNAASSSGQGN